MFVVCFRTLLLVMVDLYSLVVRRITNSGTTTQFAHAAALQTYLSPRAHCDYKILTKIAPCTCKLWENPPPCDLASCRCLDLLEWSREAQYCGARGDYANTLIEGEDDDAVLIATPTVRLSPGTAGYVHTYAMWMDGHGWTVHKQAAGFGCC